MLPTEQKDKLQAAASRGAKLLDEKEPGWYKSIPLALLDMRNGCKCVLGYLYKEQVIQPCQAVSSGFGFGRRILFKDDDQLTQSFFYGFTAGNESWDHLEQCWKQEITRRMEDENKQETWRDRPSLL